VHIVKLTSNAPVTLVLTKQDCFEYILCLVRFMYIKSINMTYEITAKESTDFYARKQLLLSARLSHHNSVCLSVCPSVHPSHGWISQKR